MKFLKPGILFISIIFIYSHSFSQIKVGDWRDHFSYKKTSFVADAGDKVYVASEMALFSYDKEEGSIEKLNKINGLSDSEIQTIAYNKDNNSLVIAYKNSNIDILKDQTIHNLSEIKRKQISFNKTINKITFIGNIAYLSCGFGIVLLNTDKLEFSDTYFIGENASYLNINDVNSDGEYLYAATDQGLFLADLNSQNLSDYRNWHLDSRIPDADFKYNILNYFNEYFFANRIDPISQNDTLYILNNNSWTIFNEDLNDLKSITKTNNRIVFTSNSYAKVYDTSLSYLKKIIWYNFNQGEISTRPNMEYAVVDDDANFFIADSYYGLVHTNFSYLQYTYPNGPADNKTAQAESFGNKIITTNGNNNSTGWEQPIYNVFEGENWETYKITSDTARNFFSIAVNPNNPDNLFIGSWGYGVFEFNHNTWENNYNHLNSSLQFISGYDYGYIRINDLTFDNNNNLWISNELVGEPISVKTPDNEWQSFNFNGSVTNYYPYEIIVTKNNYKWVVLGDSKGLLVFDDNNTPIIPSDDIYKIIKPVTDDGETISTVYAVSEDKNGTIWIGTDQGVLVYYNPDDVFSDNFIADRIQLTAYGNDTTEQYLLSTDVISAIKTDGANRKWIATRNSGVFLISENGKEEIHNFNMYNSPLISNTIKDITINQQSGEVFFLTDKGIMSYRSDATEADDFFQDVYVFPNPVRPEYTGKITITGLAEDVYVKITDISGTTVFETTALGGQAIWDGKTFDGRKVSTGIYLVFCTNNDGSQTFVTKFLFMN